MSACVRACVRLSSLTVALGCTCHAAHAVLESGAVWDHACRTLWGLRGLGGVDGVGGVQFANSQALFRHKYAEEVAWQRHGVQAPRIIHMPGIADALWCDGDTLLVALCLCVLCVCIAQQLQMELTPTARSICSVSLARGCHTVSNRLCDVASHTLLEC